MKSTILTLSCLAATTFGLGAQDLGYYKFESNCGTEAINYASGASALPNGVLESNGGTPWTTGRFGGGLTGGIASTEYHRLRTGWVNPNHTGDFTYAFFMRERGPVGTSLAYLAGGAGSFRLFTNGVANRGLYQREIVASGGSPSARDLHLMTDVQTLAAAGWVHIALVIDATAQTAIWYVDGQQDTVVNGVGGALISENGEVFWGTHTSTSLVSSYEFDEVLLSTRAYSAADILALSLSPRGADGSYTAGMPQCGSTTVTSSGGEPGVGNSSYTVNVNSTALGSYTMLLGLQRCTFAGGAFNLPLDLGTFLPTASGCNLLTGGELGSFGGVLTGNPVNAPLGIPSGATLLGVDLFMQAVVFDAVNNSFEASNGFAIQIGI